MVHSRAWGKALVLAAVLAAMLSGVWIFPATVVVASVDQDVPVTIDQFHIIVAPEGDRIRVAEVYLLGNPTDEGYANEDGLTLIFPLPAGAQDVIYDGAEDGSGAHRRVADGIAETRPVPPGAARLETRFAYQLPFAPGTRVAHPMPLPMESGVLLISGTAWKLGERDLESGAYTDLGVMEFGGELARTYMISSLAAGEMLAFEIVEEEISLLPGGASGQGPIGFAGGAAASRLSSAGTEVGLGIVALIAAMAVSYGLWRSSPSSPFARERLQTQSGGVQAGAPPALVLADLHAIVDLDAQYEAGRMDARAYHRLRQELKARVRTAVAEMTLDDRDPRAD
jgi:hypothetical protein